MAKQPRFRFTGILDKGYTGFLGHWPADTAGADYYVEKNKLPQLYLLYFPFYGFALTHPGWLFAPGLPLPRNFPPP